MPRTRLSSVTPAEPSAYRNGRRNRPRWRRAPDGTTSPEIDGTILATGGEMNFPLYGWQYQGQNLENGLSQNTNNIDQIDAIFRHGLTPPD
jgi:hypothetical protein